MKLSENHSQAQSVIIIFLIGLCKHKHNFICRSNLENRIKLSLDRHSMTSCSLWIWNYNVYIHIVSNPVFFFSFFNVDSINPFHVLLILVQNLCDQFFFPFFSLSTRQLTVPSTTWRLVFCCVQQLYVLSFLEMSSDVKSATLVQCLLHLSFVFTEENTLCKKFCGF